MRRLLLLSTLSAAFIAFAAACEDGTDFFVIDEPSSTLLVESNADEGEGSLRAALETASSDPVVNSIQVTSGVGTVTLSAPLEYSGSQALRIVGNGVTLDGEDCGCDVLVSTGGADLDLYDLTLSNGDDGLRVLVPTGATGEVRVRLSGVTADGNDGYGLYVAEEEEGSAASLRVELASTTVTENGTADGSEHLDGIRVEEKAEGALTFVANGVEATGNAGDGLALIEEGEGNLVADVQDSTLDENGEHPQDTSNPEDGFDAREEGPGSLDVRLLSTSAESNHGEGVELTESGAGDLRATLTELQASENGGDNLLLREDVDAEGGTAPGEGGIIAGLTQVTAGTADDDGAEIEEFGAGDVNVQIQDGDFTGNVDDGLIVSQKGTGRGQLLLVRVLTDGNGGLPVVSTGTTVREGSDQTTVARVRTDKDSGFGSFRSALEMATDDSGITTILFESAVGTIEITESLEYGGTQDLVIRGGEAVVDAEDCECDAFVVTGEGNVVVEALDFRNGPEDGLTLSGGGNLTLRDLVLRDMEGNGIFMDVDADAEDVVKVILEDAVILDNGLHGIHIDDLADAGGSGTGGNSAAGILLEMEGSTVQGNGFRQDVTDRDGIRIEEGGSGSIEVRLTESVVTGNAGDGLELREEGLGDLVLDFFVSRVDDNGSQPQNPDEMEDGVDLTELGPGNVQVEFRGTATQTASFRNSGDMGMEITEEGSGDVTLELGRLVATGNGTGTLAVTEDADAENEPAEGSGGIVASLKHVTLGQAGEEGVWFREFGVGDLVLTGEALDSSDNGSDGLRVQEHGIGKLTMDFRDSLFDDNGRDPLNPEELEDGVEVTEDGPGLLRLELQNVSVQRNGGTGVEVTEEGSGDVELHLVELTITRNDGGSLMVTEDADAADGAADGDGSLAATLGAFTGGQSDEDGVALEEHGEGNLTLTAWGLESTNNGKNGLRLQEAGDGDLVVDARDSFFDDNGALAAEDDDPGDGVEAREEGSGTADVRLLDTSLVRNDRDGLDVVEAGDGNLRGTLTVVTATNNGQDNLRLVEDGEPDGSPGTGKGTLYVAFTEITSSRATEDGIHLAEYEDGTLAGQISASTVSLNGDNGIEATQGGDEEGQLQLVDVTLERNGSDDIESDGVTVTEVSSS